MRNCKRCNKKIEIRSHCNACRVYLSNRNKLDNLNQKVLGNQCECCGYTDDSNRVLELHHVNEEKKRFQLSTSTISSRKEKLKIELMKCVFLCPTCHKEYHTGVKSLKEMIKLQTSYWNKNRIRLLEDWANGKQHDWKSCRS